MTCSEACLVLDTLVLLAYKEKNTHIYDNCKNKSKEALDNRKARLELVFITLFELKETLRNVGSNSRLPQGS